jgi:hypothetical protein
MNKCGSQSQGKLWRPWSDSFIMGSLTASVFFFKFYTRTRDSLFLAFAVAFGIEALNRAATLGLGRSHEDSPWTYVIRLCSFLIIRAAIIKKNYWGRA